MDKIELINLERLAHILKGLNDEELETLEILLNDNEYESIRKSIKELDARERVPINEW